MNYYKHTSTDQFYEPTPVVNLPTMIIYKQFTDKAHSSLERCSDCGLKVDIHSLVRIDVGVFVCKFCIKGAA